MTEEPRESATLARITAVTPAVPSPNENELVETLAPAAAAALRLLADAIKRGHAGPDAIIQALKDAKVHEAFADVFDGASAAVVDGMEDPFEFDERLHADNLSGAAGQVRDAFRWL